MESNPKLGSKNRCSKTGAQKANIYPVLQRPGDTSLRNLIAKHGSHEGFISYTVNEIRKYTDRKIVVDPVLVDVYGN